MKPLLLLFVVVVGCKAQEYTGVDGSGPHFLKQPVDTIFNEDSNIQVVHLECEAEGDTTPTYVWRQKKGDQAWEEVAASGRYQLSRGRLSISDPDRELDEKLYQCLASNQIGTIMSQVAQLEFAYLLPFPQSGPEPQAIPVNSGKCISCNLPANHPGVSMIWVTGNSPDDVRKPVFLDSSNHATDDGQLCFANFQEGNAGWYICYARNVIVTGGASVSKYSAAFQVTSLPQVANADSSVQVAIAVEDKVAIVNDEVTLSCFFFGNPAPNIAWHRKSPAGASLPNGSEQKSFNQVLILKNVQVEDAGEYECQALDSGTGDVLNTTSGMVEVKVPPTWVQELADLTGNIYESLSLECEAESPDGVAYTWYVNAEEITDQSGYQLSNGLKTLTFQNLTTEHTGMYQCKASNDYGEIYTTSELIVLAIAPYFREELKRDQSAPRGGEVTIECKPEASPTPTVSWTKGSQAITTDGHYTVLPNGNLMITDVADSDAGEYTCTATNSQGTGASTGSLVIRDGTAIAETPVDTTINEGETGTLSCQATYDPFFDLQYVWLKDGIQVDTSLPNYEQPEIATGEASRLILKDAILDQGGEYTCNAVSNIDEASASAMVTIRGRPGAPAGVRAAVSGLSANVSWSPGADNNSPITSYIIEGSTNHVPEWHVLEQDVSASVTHFRVKKLSGWSTYKFRVIAVNEVGPGEPSEESAELQTAEGRPTMEPTNVGGGGGNEGDLHITWTPVPMKDWNAPDLVYKIFWKQDGQDDTEEDEVAGTEATYTATGVPAYTLYQVRIQVKNSRGEGPMTDWQEVYSYQMRPEEAPTGLTAVAQRASAILVSWTGIDAANVVGELQGYKVKFWLQDSTEELASIQTVEGDMTEATVENLEPETQYNFRVMAYSGGGDGPLNEETVMATTLKNVTTTEMPEQTPTPIAPMQAPSGVTVTSDGEGMTVQWKAVKTSASEEPLMGYKVLYWPKGNFEADAMVKEVGKTTTEVTINGLEKGQTYYVKVLGFSAGGDGVTSDPVQEVKIVKEKEKAPRGGASAVSASVLFVTLPLLVAFHLG